VILAAAVAGPRSEVPRNLPTGKAGWNLEYFSPASSAYADEAFATELSTNSNQVRPLGEDTFIRGLKLFFGYGKEQTRSRVVVASIIDHDKAVATAENLNSMNVLPLKASVGEWKPGNDYYPVIVNGWRQSYQEAKI
jgi:hypothetical protein